VSSVICILGLKLIMMSRTRVCIGKSFAEAEIKVGVGLHRTRPALIVTFDDRRLS
jgi:hypothetical protein